MGAEFKVADNTAEPVLLVTLLLTVALVDSVLDNPEAPVEVCSPKLCDASLTAGDVESPARVLGAVIDPNEE